MERSPVCAQKNRANARSKMLHVYPDDGISTAAVGSISYGTGRRRGRRTRRRSIASRRKSCEDSPIGDSSSPSRSESPYSPLGQSLLRRGVGPPAVAPIHITSPSHSPSTSPIPTPTTPVAAWKMSRVKEPGSPASARHLAAVLWDSQELSLPAHLHSQVEQSTKSNRLPGDEYIASGDLAQMLEHLQSLEQRYSSVMPVVKELRTELDRSCAQVEELLAERKASKKEVRKLLQYFADKKKSGWQEEQEKGHENIMSAVESIEEELEEQRESKRNLEKLHKKVARELKEVKVNLARTSWELERERKAREAIQNMCSNLAREIREGKVKIEELKCEFNREEVDGKSNDYTKEEGDVGAFSKAKACSELLRASADLEEDESSTVCSCTSSKDSRFFGGLEKKNSGETEAHSNGVNEEVKRGSIGSFQWSKFSLINRARRRKQEQCSKEETTARSNQTDSGSAKLNMPIIGSTKSSWLTNEEEDEGEEECSSCSSSHAAASTVTDASFPEIEHAPTPKYQSLAAVAGIYHYNNNPTPQKHSLFARSRKPSKQSKNVAAA